jgi:glycosyltransferase involved in cell wall biosynthesis
MVPLKNTEGLLKAFRTLAEKHPIQLIMVGDTRPEHQAVAESLGLLDKSVFFKGEVSYPEVAGYMQESNCLLLFSHIENSPCVIAEALCCGLPVIATRVGGIPELINSSNGMLVQPGDEPGLATAMLEMMQNYTSYDRQGIATRSAGLFSLASVGKQFSDLYREFV